jgi:hypothetical protein
VICIGQIDETSNPSSSDDSLNSQGIKETLLSMCNQSFYNYNKLKIRKIELYIRVTLVSNIYKQEGNERKRKQAEQK